LLEGRHETYRPGNELEPTAPVGQPARRTGGSAGVEVDLYSARLDLHLIPSARLEGSRDVRTGRDPTFGTNLPASTPTDRWLPVFRLGALRPLGGGVTARGNLGRYARIPSFVELYGYNRGVVGSPDLRPERGVNADLGLTLERATAAGTLSASATLFGAAVDDLIAWQTYSGLTRAQNISRARIWGVETELRVRGRRLTVITQGTFIDARDRGSIASRAGRQLEHHPRYRGYARGEWRQPLGGAHLSLSGYGDLDGTAGNFRTTGPYSALPARLFVGGGLSLEHAPSGLRLAVSVLNLTDSRAEDFSNYPLPGRSFYVALGWSSAISPAYP
jgi:iron complex outermembrane receptor protein